MRKSNNDNLFKKLQLIFDRAIELSVEEQQNYIYSATKGDQFLIDKVNDLLSAAVNQGDEINNVLNKSLSSMMPTDRTGETIDKFDLIKKLGQGGMGEVYLARRNDNEFQQEVAIKIIRSTVNSPQLDNYFTKERQILADLNHPNICRLYDGGTTQNSESYLTMEYIEGVTLDKYYSQEHLTLRQKLELFLKISDAVQKAHQSLIVHCDLKPNNILVTSEGEPKLLDFGVAKALSPETVFEEPSEPVPLTYDYACPALLKGDPVTLSSDVFSLGVILTELISGRYPKFIAKTTLDKIKKYRARFTESLPSDSLQSDVQQITQYITDRKLRAICSKASSYQVGMRYQTVSELQADIKRYINGYPVEAETITVFRRFQSWIKRKKYSIAVVSTMILTLSLWATRESQLRDEALQEANVRTQVTNFLTNLFSEASPGRNRGKEASVREIVDIGTKNILSNESIEAKVRIELLRTLRSVNNSLGYFDKGQKVSELAVQLLEKHEPKNRQLKGELYTELAGGYYNQDKFQEASDWYQKAMSEWDKFSRPPANAYHTFAQYSQLTRKNGFPEKALDYINQAIRIAEENNLDSLKMEALNTKSITLDLLERTDESIKIYEELLPLNEEVTGRSSPSYFINLLNYGLMLKDVNQIESAKANISEALELAKTTYPNGHPDVGYIHDSMGNLFLDIGEYRLAKSHFIKSRQSQRDFDRVASMDYVLATTNFGELYEEWEYFEKAQELYLETLAIKQQMFPEGHIEIGKTNLRLGEIFRKQGQYKLSKKHLKTALDIFTKYSATSRINYAYRLHGLLELEQNKPTLAGEYFAKDKSPLLKRKRAQALKHYHSALLSIQLKELLHAKEQLNNAIALMIEEANKDHPLVAKYQLKLAEVYFELNEIQHAKKLLRSSHANLTKILPNNGPSLTLAQNLSRRMGIVQ